MTLIRRLRTFIDNARLADEQWKLIEVNRELVQTLREVHAAEMNRVRLDHLREKQHMLIAWLISIEKPEEDVREGLAETERVLAEHIAMFEEHIM